MNLPLPAGATPEVHVIDGVQYLVARLPDEQEAVATLAAKLASGIPVMARTSQRGHLTGLLKRSGTFTRHRTITPEWVLFTPTGKRNFK